jgi:thiosulfate dehydrogenase
MFGRSRARRVAALGFMVAAGLSFMAAAQDRPVPGPAWSLPDIDALADDDHGRRVRYGRELVARTYAHVGPNVSDPAKRYAGNNLACQNCHLHAGTKRFGLALWGLDQVYPQFSERSDRSVTLADRVNACMTRSMNGRPMAEDAPEMRAIVAYLGFLSTGVPAGQHLSGRGTVPIPELERAADPARGRGVYARVCAECHGAGGGGLRRGTATTDLGYMVPPLWGPDSFNDGAGMARLSTAAQFIHANMPNGTDYLSPRLPPEAAWDVAAFVLSQPRPAKAGLDTDFADPLEKPVDAPYGPYVDGFSAEQHRYGPFGPIRARIEALRRERAGRRP